MNLFATSPCPVESAQALDTLRVINQCRETGQMLSTGLRARGFSAPYKTAHAHHPVTRWVNACAANFLWTLDHLTALATEHQHRYPTSDWHLSYRVHLPVVEACRGLRRAKPTAFPNSARNEGLAVDFSNIPDVHEAYKLYLKARWDLAAKPPKWGNRHAPEWLSTLRTITPNEPTPKL